MLSALSFYLAVGGIVGYAKGLHLGPDFHFHLSAYFKSIVVISASALGSSLLLRRVGVERLLSAILILMTVCCVAIAVSPLFGYAYLVAPDTSAVRLSGSFVNPNQAGFFGCLTLVLALSLLSFHVNRKMAYIGLTLSTIVAVGSFSRAAILIVIIVYAWFLASSFIVRREIAKWFVGIIIIVGIAWAATDLKFVNLHGQQLHRLKSILSVFSQEQRSDSSWSKRALLLELSIEEVLHSPLVGNGLGTLHSLQEAPYINSQGKPQGAHNQYLVIAGESGMVPLLLFLVFFFSVLRGPRAASRSLTTATVAGWSLVLALYLLTSHSALTLRSCNFLIGLACAMSGAYRITSRPESRLVYSEPMPRDTAY